MKVWKGYGTEHSLNLIMVGEFKTVKDAEKTQQIIERLSDELVGKIDFGSNETSYSKEIRDLLTKENIYFFAPFELEHFLHGDNKTRRSGKKIILATDEPDVSAFMKLMVHRGARVDIFSAHDYPELKHLGEG